MVRKRLVLLPLFCWILSATSLSAEVVLNVKDFDPACGQPRSNCRSAFQKAFDAAGKAGGGTLRLPAGTFSLDFPEVSNDVQTGKPLAGGSLITVPPRVVLQGHVDANGAPDTVIEWKVTSVPVLVFAGASYAGMRDLHLRFTGVMPTRFPYGDIALLRALGFKPTFPHADQMSGGNYEMFSFAMLFDSEHCVFDNLVFDSATHDNQHVFGFAFDVKGKGVSVTGGGGGLTGLADGNSFSRIRLLDYVMGLLVSGQENVVIENVTADRRGSTTNIAPGHVIYFTVTNSFGPDGKASVLLSKNVRVANISEGSETYSNVNSLGTLAVKYIDGGTFDHIVSQHPAGVIQTFVMVKNLVFSDVKWTRDSAICDQPAVSCGIPVIESAVVPPGGPPIENLRFAKIVLKSTREFISVNLIGRGIEVDGITIEAPPVFNKGQKGGGSALSLRDASEVAVKGYVYIPDVFSLDPGVKYNQPFVCWGSCANVKADVTVEWPKGVSPPPAGSEAIKSSFQFDKPGAGNSIVSRTKIN